MAKTDIEIVYQSNEWKEILSNLWNRAKAVNLDFRGVDDEKEFLERTLGKSEFKKISDSYEKSPHLITTFTMFTCSFDKSEWVPVDVDCAYIDLTDSIEKHMDKHSILLIKLTGEEYMINNKIAAGKTVETIIVKRGIYCVK